MVTGTDGEVSVTDEDGLKVQATWLTTLQESTTTPANPPVGASVNVTSTVEEGVVVTEVALSAPVYPPSAVTANGME